MAAGRAGARSRDNFLIRGTPNNRGTVLKMLLDAGVQPVGDPTQCHAVAIDARAPKFDGGIITRLDCVVFGIVVNKHGERFYDEGEDVWPKRYAIWGRLVAMQPDQIAYIVFDAPVLTIFMPSLYPPIAAGEHRRACRQARASTRRRWRRRSATFNAAVRPGTFDHTILDDCRTEGLDAAEDPLGAAHREGAVLCLSGAARHHLHLSRHAGEPGGAHRHGGRPAVGQHVRRRRDHGRQRAGPGLRRRHRHDHRQRVRPHRRQEAAARHATATDGSQRGASPNQPLQEAARLMTVCNSCRYCEGLCAVFPAMEMRRVFAAGDLNYLANLCHACGACYVDCQFSPPHEFNVNVPRVLAEVRAESYAAYAWPRALSGLFDRNGLAIASIAALSVAAFIVGFVAWHDPAALFAVHTGPGAFYRLMPHDAMVAIFGAAFLYAIVASVMGMRAFWRDIGEPAGTLAQPASLWQAIKDAATLRYLDGGGVGCFNEDDAPTDRRRLYHHLTFYGFLLCFASTCTATVYHYGLGRLAPYAWYDLPVMLGTLGGIGLIDRAGRAHGREDAPRPGAGRPGEPRHGRGVPGHALPHQPDRPALLALRETRGHGPPAGAASRRGVGAVPHLALREVRARPLPLPGAGAVCQGAADTAVRRCQTLWV